MDLHALMERLLADRSAVDALIKPLPEERAAAVVERLKNEADRHWAINANRSLELAELIIQIGHARANLSQIALGMMARGDALKFLGRNAEAWSALDEAGTLFQQAGDEVGWARTRIGRLPISVRLSRVPEALADADHARRVFTTHGEPEKRLRLDFNTAVLHNYLGDQHQALQLFLAALATADELGDTGRQYVGMLYTNIGFTYEALGDFHVAQQYHQRARARFEELNESRHVAIAETNIAIIAMKQGRYRRALTLLHRARTLYEAENLARDAAEVNRSIVECYLLLNRFAEARELATEVIAAFHSFGEPNEEALTLLELATAEAKLKCLPAAQAALDAAEPIFAELGTNAWVATTRLRRGRIALAQGDTTTAQREARFAAACFKAGGQQVPHAEATLLHGQALLAAGALDAAEEAGLTAMETARHCNVPALRYTANLLLGRIAAAQGRDLRAARRYHAAAATVERVQRDLTITLRPGFLEDKEEAIKALLEQHLRAGNATRAFETLERAKSQILLSHLTNREQFRWALDDEQSRMLIADLNQLRAEHQWFYEMAHDQLRSDDGRPSARSSQQALQELADRERRMRAITEQLYLNSGQGGSASRTHAPSSRAIQQSLGADELLIEFYNDGADVWAFTADQHTLDVRRLPTAVGTIDHLLAQVQVNLAAALKAGSEATITRQLTGLLQRLLQRLYAGLLAPLADRMAGRGRLVIVPYGGLHYLPFHLLHTGQGYLIERYEVVVQPAAGLMTRRAPMRRPGALVLAHSWDGRLRKTHAEAKIVQRLFSGDLFSDETASRSTLAAQPVQILHIAAHGEHRLDQPDLSYIQLADGQLYTDDLLQHDLSYELVTLSACETGRAKVVAGDELIGLGRGFLYAGAGALLVSLWRVPDDSAIELMEAIYRMLRSGSSKAAALRAAQRAMYADAAQLHPAFWGAFQLVGNASPLSVDWSHVAKKERVNVLLTANGTKR